MRCNSQPPALSSNQVRCNWRQLAATFRCDSQPLVAPGSHRLSQGAIPDLFLAAPFTWRRDQSQSEASRRDSLPADGVPGVPGVPGRPKTLASPHGPPSPNDVMVTPGCKFQPLAGASNSRRCNFQLVAAQSNSMRCNS